ncbi:nitrilase [Pseudohyphozyma bogoriensis]|nr:nitrilase [Pseudohyphozyma bogoriensis]
MKVAAVQAEPVWLDLAGGVDKVCKLIKEASSNGAEVIGFPEVFIPGFPHKLFTGAPDQEFVLQYQKNSLSRKSPEYTRILQAVREAGAWVVFGFSEREGGTIYMAQSFINPSGEVVLHRRKIKPTHAERYLWGDGQADSLQTSVTTDDGVVIGGLNCWEHLQPLLRFHEYSLHTQIHIASWPHLQRAAPGMSYATSADASANAMSFMALEGGLFVLACTATTSKEGSKVMQVADDEKELVAVPIEGGGWSAIYGPDGRQLTNAVDPCEEIILYADIDLDDILRAKQMADCVGHYSRPDLLSLNVTSNKATLVHY